MRKTRSDAILLNLPEEQQAKLAEWLLSGVPYHEAKLLVEKEFGVAVKSLDSFRSFWEQVCVPLLLVKRQRSLKTADSRAMAVTQSPGQFDLATLDAIKQRAYELSESPGADPKDVKAILMLVLKARDQDLQERQLAFDREKFQWDAAQACLLRLPELKAISADKGLNETQRVEQIRLKLFGVLPEKN